MLARRRACDGGEPRRSRWRAIATARRLGHRCVGSASAVKAVQVRRERAALSGGAAAGAAVPIRATPRPSVPCTCGKSPPPRLPGEAWVRVRPRLAGICGSDLATLTAQGSTYFAPFTSYPFVFGHEVVGEVTEVGAEVGDLDVGHRVVLAAAAALRRARHRGALRRRAATGSRRIATTSRAAVSRPASRPAYCADTGGGWSESFVAHRGPTASRPGVHRTTVRGAGRALRVLPARGARDAAAGRDAPRSCSAPARSAR